MPEEDRGISRSDNVLHAKVVLGGQVTSLQATAMKVSFVENACRRSGAEANQAGTGTDYHIA